MEMSLYLTILEHKVMLRLERKYSNLSQQTHYRLNSNHNYNSLKKKKTQYNKHRLHRHNSQVSKQSQILKLSLSSSNSNKLRVISLMQQSWTPNPRLTCTTIKGFLIALNI